MIRFAIALLLLAAPAWAQTYPSPTFQNLTVTGSINGNAFVAVLPTDADATPALTRAITQALAAGQPVEVDIPCGNYRISSAIAITTAASQGVYIKGASASCVTISQTADADVFDVSLTNYGGVLGTGSLRISGIQFIMAAAASTARKAIAVSSTAVSGAAGVPLQLDDLTFSSPSSAAYWGNEIWISEIPDAVYISRINAYYAGGGAGVHISINGNASSYTTSVFVHDTFLVGGARGIELGNYLQGVHLDNINTVSTAFSLYAAPTAGNNEEIQVANSYLDGLTHLGPTGSAVMSAVSFAHTYFDGLGVIAAGNTLVALNNIGILHLLGNTYNGVATVANTTGLSISGSVVTPAAMSGEVFSNFANGGTALKVSVSTYALEFDNFSFNNNTTAISDTSTVANYYPNATVNNQVFSYGAQGNGLTFLAGMAGTSLEYINALGADANIQTVITAKGLPAVDFNFRDGISHPILVLADSQSATVGNGVTIKAGATGLSPNIGPNISTTEILLGCAGSPLAASITGCLPQIPYVAAAPTGTPATTGGATVVYNTTSHNLNIYDPVAAGWYHVALTVGAN